MIARTWHGMTKAARADEYMDYLNKTGLPEYRATPGNLGVYVFRRIEGSTAHFLLLTLWEDEAAIRRFAGRRWKKPSITRRTMISCSSSSRPSRITRCWPGRK